MIKKRKKVKVAFVVLPPLWPNLPSLGLAYLVGNIKYKKDFDIKIFDFNIEVFRNSPKSLRNTWTIGDYKAGEKILNSININEFFFTIVKNIKEFDIVGFTVFSSNDFVFLNFLEYLKDRKEEFKFNTLFLAGGPEITLKYFAGKSLNEFYKGIDYFFIGDSEFTFNFFLNQYKLIFDKDEYKKNIITKDLISKNENIKIPIKNLLNNYIKSILLNDNIVSSFHLKINLDTIKFPDFSVFDLKKYLRHNALPILSSRGCIGNCKFCTERRLYRGYRIRTSENIINEIKYQIEKYKIKWFTFYDSLINGNLENFKELLKKIINNNIKIYWDGQFLIRKIDDEEIFKLIKDSGNFNLFIGLESGSDRVLKLMRKSFNTKIAEDLFKKFYKYNIFFEISLIVGFPGETDNDFNETLKFLEKNKKYIPKIAQINKFVLYNSLEDYHEFLKYVNNEEYKITVENRFKKIIKFIKNNGFKFTDSYIGNLIE